MAASPVPDESPIDVSPVLATLKRVDIVLAVEEEIENSEVFVSPLFA
jgi:hypothetical protein